MFFCVVFAVSLSSTRNTLVRVVNGQDAPKDKYPWVVALDAKIKGDASVYSCGGSLIHPQYVLTAAHCFAPNRKRDWGKAYIGSYKTCFGLDGCANREKQTIAQLTLHPNYDDLTTENDIALIKLSSPVTSVTPVPIRKQPFLKQHSFGTDRDAIVLGWGVDNLKRESMPDVLQLGKLEMVNRVDCHREFGYSKAELLEGMVCAKSAKSDMPKSLADACQGDSGGPLFVPSSGEQVGIVSWGESCGGKTFPGVYTDIGYYYKWIAGIVGWDQNSTATPSVATQRPTVTTAPTQAPSAPTPTTPFTWRRITGPNLRFFLSFRCDSDDAGIKLSEKQPSQKSCRPLCSDGCFGYDYNTKYKKCTLYNRPIKGPVKAGNKFKCFKKDFGLPTAAPTPSTQAPAPTPAPTCTCRKKWSFGKKTYRGCADAEGDEDEHPWCYTTSECTGSKISTTYNGWHWAKCELPKADECLFSEKAVCLERQEGCFWVNKGSAKGCHNVAARGICSTVSGAASCRRKANCYWESKGSAKGCLDKLVCERNTNVCCGLQKGMCGKKKGDCEWAMNTCVPL